MRALFDILRLNEPGLGKYPQYNYKEKYMDNSLAYIPAFKHAIELALEAEQQGNLPIGAVVTYEVKIIAEGKNAIWAPHFNQNRHAEIEALRNVPQEYWTLAPALTLVTTLEPCVMCLGSILLHRIGRVLFGSADPYGGASTIFGSMPPFFETQLSAIIWLGPAYADECDRLFQRVMNRVENRKELWER